MEEHWCDPLTRPDDNQTSCQKDPCPAVWVVPGCQHFTSLWAGRTARQAPRCCLHSFGLFLPVHFCLNLMAGSKTLVSDCTLLWVTDAAVDLFRHSSRLSWAFLDVYLFQIYLLCVCRYSADLNLCAILSAEAPFVPLIVSHLSTPPWWRCPLDFPLTFISANNGHNLRLSSHILSVWPFFLKGPLCFLFFFFPFFCVVFIVIVISTVICFYLLLCPCQASRTWPI